MSILKFSMQRSSTFNSFHKKKSAKSCPISLKESEDGVELSVFNLGKPTPLLSSSRSDSNLLKNSGKPLQNGHANVNGSVYCIDDAISTSSEESSEGKEQYFSIKIYDETLSKYVLSPPKKLFKNK